LAVVLCVYWGGLVGYVRWLLPNNQYIYRPMHLLHTLKHR